MTYTDKEWQPVVDRIEELLDSCGTLRELSKRIGVDPGQLSLARSGKKRYMSDETFAKLGLERIVVIRVKGKVQ